MKTRSPDLAAAGATGVPSLTCMNVVRAIATPAEAQPAWVSEEQSQELGPLDPYTYGLPSWASANAAARFPTGDPVEAKPCGITAEPPPGPVPATPHGSGGTCPGGAEGGAVRPAAAVVEVVAAARDQSCAVSAAASGCHFA